MKFDECLDREFRKKKKKTIWFFFFRLGNPIMCLMPDAKTQLADAVRVRVGWQPHWLLGWKVTKRTSQLFLNVWRFSQRHQYGANVGSYGNNTAGVSCYRIEAHMHPPPSGCDLLQRMFTRLEETVHLIRRCALATGLFKVKPFPPLSFDLFTAPF